MAVNVVILGYKLATDRQFLGIFELKVLSCFWFRVHKFIQKYSTISQIRPMST